MLFLKNLAFTIVAPGSIGVYVPLMMARGRPHTSGPLLALAVALLAAGASLYLWCVWDFASYGRATPAPIDAPKKLVVRGFYRRVRNPMYVGVCTLILGWAVMFRSQTLVVYALGAWIMFHTFVILYEEPHLKKTFGAEYDEYRARVRRWLPRRRPHP